MLKQLLEILYCDKLLVESTIKPIAEKTTIAWARRGNKVVRRLRCPFGRRKGKIVTNLSACSAPRNIKRSVSAKRTRAAKGKVMARRAKRTRRINPASKRAKAMNKSMRRK